MLDFKGGKNSYCGVLSYYTVYSGRQISTFMGNILWHEAWQLEYGARETAIARQQLRKHATIPEPSVGNVRSQQWRNHWKSCFLCDPRRRHTRGPRNGSSHWQKIQSLGWRRIFYAKKYSDRGGSRFRLCPNIVHYIYFNGFDQRLARQQLCKHSPTRNNRGSCVFCRSDRRANRLAG
jgi:hypothetical protein